MPDEVTPSISAQGTEDAAPQAPSDFREFAKWRATGELPEQKEETPPAAADEPPAKTAPDSETDDSQETGDEKEEGDEGAPAKGRGRIAST